MKKIILLALGMVFLTNCGNNVAVKPENRESFTENPYFKSEEFLSLKNKEERLQYIKENEYNTFLEALKNTFVWGEGVWEDVLNSKKSMEYVEKIEKIAKSKFVSFIESSGECYIYFTAVDDVGNSNIFGKKGKYNIVEVYFYHSIRYVKNVEKCRKLPY